MLDFSIFRFDLLRVGHTPRRSFTKMAQKRSRDADDAAASNPSAGGQEKETHKRRKGFTVGPENLPDGTYRRKSKQSQY